MRASATTLEPEMTQAELGFLKDHLHSDGCKAGLLEIGTAAGGTLCEMMGAYSDEERPQFTVVDPMNYFPNQFEIVKTNLNKHGFNPDSVNFLLGRSNDLFQIAKAKGETFDFILVDGSHKLLYVTQDIQWAGLLNVGGTIFFHDYFYKTSGVISAVDRFLKMNKNYEVLKLVDTLMAIRKIKESTRPEVNLVDRIRAQILRPIFQLRTSLDKRFNKK